jgi:hypothetical protein
MQFDLDALLQNGTLWPASFNATREYEVFVEHASGFVNTIDWSERWLQALLAAHVVCFVSIVVWRNNSRVQTALFFTLLLGCFSASFVDAWAAQNWRLFTRQNYFGRGGGVFVAVVYALPMVLNSLLILVNFVREIARLLIQVKREQLRRQKAAVEPKKTK